MAYYDARTATSRTTLTALPSQFYRFEVPFQVHFGRLCHVVHIPLHDASDPLAMSPETTLPRLLGLHGVDCTSAWMRLQNAVFACTGIAVPFQLLDVVVREVGEARLDPLTSPQRRRPDATPTVSLAPRETLRRLHNASDLHELILEPVLALQQQHEAFTAAHGSDRPSVTLFASVVPSSALPSLYTEAGGVAYGEAVSTFGEQHPERVAWMQTDIGNLLTAFGGRSSMAARSHTDAAFHLRRGYANPLVTMAQMSAFASIGSGSGDLRQSAASQRSRHASEKMSIAEAELRVEEALCMVDHLRSTRLPTPTVVASSIADEMRRETVRIDRNYSTTGQLQPTTYSSTSAGFLPSPNHRPTSPPSDYTPTVIVIENGQRRRISPNRPQYVLASSEGAASSPSSYRPTPSASPPPASPYSLRPLRPLGSIPLPVLAPQQESDTTHNNSSSVSTPRRSPLRATSSSSAQRPTSPLRKSPIPSPLSFRKVTKTTTTKTVTPGGTPPTPASPAKSLQRSNSAVASLRGSQRNPASPRTPTSVLSASSTTLRKTTSTSTTTAVTPQQQQQPSAFAGR